MEAFGLILMDEAGASKGWGSQRSGLLFSEQIPFSSLFQATFRNPEGWTLLSKGEDFFKSQG